MTEDKPDYFPCAKCGKMTHIDDLDAKPPQRIHEYPGQWIVRAIWIWWQRRFGTPGDSGWDDPDGNTNWERFECERCYGPGFESSQEAARG